MLHFHFDFLSPYAWLAWNRVHDLAARHGRGVEPVPTLLAALLSRWGHKGPAEIPPKRAWVLRNTARLARRMGVPLVPPPAHPFNPLVALRVASLPGERRREVIDALWRATWAGGPGVGDAETVARVLDDAGFDGRALVAAAGEPDAKERLRRQSDEALAAGVFGVPTIRVDGELFWGLDAFPDVEEHLEGREPVDPALIARWRDLPAAAQRK
ncbi:MAG: 2-hydroxychromene-2-carboxylate isomerase [Myxococcota bacterium]